MSRRTLSILPGCLLGGLLGAATATPALAQKSGGDELPRISISDPNRDLFRLALPNVVGDADLGRQTLEIERRAFEIVGLFRVLDPVSFPPDLQKEGMNFSSNAWSQVGAQGVLKVNVTRAGGGIKLQGALYQVGRGDTAVLTKSYQGGELRPLVHKFVNDVIEQFTGQRGIFGSRIAFATVGRSRDIATVEADGSDMHAVVKMNTECQMPAFSRGGDQIAFTSHLRGTPDLYIVSAGGGRPRALSRRIGLNTGAVFAPDGRSIVLTLSYEGNSELYRISPTDGKQLARLTNNSAADLSATFSPDGSQIAFVSDRQGTPQIFVMSASGGQPKRLTFQGTYNQTPSWNPNKNKPLIAFTGRDERKVFDIFVYDLRTSKIDRLTQGKGSNSSPSWSPDGRLLVYTSARSGGSGLYVLNPETGTEQKIWSGAAESPTWGPVPQ